MGVKGQPWVENTDSHSDKEAILFLKTEAFPIIVIAISILYRKTTHTHTHTEAKVLLIDKGLILLFKLGQAQGYEIESYQKNKYKYELSLCGRQKVNIFPF